jgi:LPS sulfotransferase NodH
MHDHIPAMRRSTPTRFVVLTSPRSGSTWFVDTLNRAPGVAAYGELFQPGRMRPFIWGARGFPSYVVYRREGRGSAPTYLRELFAAQEGAAAVGFKLMYRHAVEHPQALAYLRLRRARVLHLVRRNGVDVAFSRAAIEARPYGHVTDSSTLDPVALTLDPAAVVADVRAHQRGIRIARIVVAASLAPRLEVSYEDLCDTPGRALAEVAEFLGLEAPPSFGTSPLRKQSAGQGEGVANLAEVRQALVEAGFGKLLRGR